MPNAPCHSLWRAIPLLRPISFCITVHLLIASSAAAENAPHHHLGADDCRSCHALSIDSPQQRSPWVGENEYLIWQDHDRHSRAFQSLLPTGDPQAPLDQMERLLEINASQDNRCLACHAPLSQVPALASDPQTLRQQGVSCEACHGPSEAWSTPHRFATWRGRLPAEKAELGMRDLRDPFTKAQVCTSCHVGDAASGRLVTHAMYAAGHPPLSGIEVVGYSQNMPPHWTSLRNKPADLTRNLPHYDSDQLLETKTALLSSAVAFRQLMKLIAADADRADHAQDNEPANPEFALYDCHACHHALVRSNNSWRQQPAYVLQLPGRPRAARWTFALLEVATQITAADEPAAAESLVKLENGYLIQPFGHPANLRAAAHDAVAWSTRLIENLQQAPLSRTAGDADRITKLIATTTDPTDFDTARQLAWTLEVLTAEHHQRPLIPTDKPSPWAQAYSLYLPSEVSESFRLRHQTQQLRASHNPAQFRTLLNQLLSSPPTAAESAAP